MVCALPSPLLQIVKGLLSHRADCLRMPGKNIQKQQKDYITPLLDNTFFAIGVPAKLMTATKLPSIHFHKILDCLNAR